MSDQHSRVTTSVDARYMRYVRADLPSVLELTENEIDILINNGVLPKAREDNVLGFSWRAQKIKAWKWGLLNSVKLSRRVHIALGYRYDHWAE